MHSLQRVLLDQGHVLEGGGVEHQVRPLLGEDAQQGGFVAHVAQGRAPGRRVRQAVHLLADRVEVELRGVEQDHPARRIAANLARQFRADRPAGAGDQHPLAGDQLVQGGAVEHRLGPAQQVGQGDRPGDRGLGGGVVGEIDQPRQDAHAHAMGAGQVEEFGDVVLADPVVGDDQALRPDLALVQEGHGAAEVVGRAQHRHPVKVPAMQVSGVGEDGHGGVGPVLVARQVADERFDALQLADHDHRHRMGMQTRVGGEGLGDAAVGAGAGGHPGQGHQGRHQEEGQHRRQARRVGERRRPDQQGHEHQGGQERHPHDADRVGQRGVAPHRPVLVLPVGHRHAEQAVRQGARQQGLEVRQAADGPDLAGGDIVGKDEGGRRGQRVVGKGRQHTGAGLRRGGGRGGGADSHRLCL